MCVAMYFFFFKQKTAYELRISDWSSDVCSSDLEVKTPFITDLYSPFGMALVGSTLYVANADAVVAFPYTPGATRIDTAPRKIAGLPAGRNHHWTKSLVANRDGSRLYVGVGSNSNIADQDRKSTRLNSRH